MRSFHSLHPFPFYPASGFICPFVSFRAALWSQSVIVKACTELCEAAEIVGNLLNCSLSVAEIVDDCFVLIKLAKESHLVTNICFVVTTYLQYMIYPCHPL